MTLQDYRCIWWSVLNKDCHNLLYVDGCKWKKIVNNLKHKRYTCWCKQWNCSIQTEIRLQYDCDLILLFCCGSLFWTSSLVMSHTLRMLSWDRVTNSFMSHVRTSTREIECGKWEDTSLPVSFDIHTTLSLQSTIDPLWEYILSIHFKCFRAVTK